MTPHRSGAPSIVLAGVLLASCAAAGAGPGAVRAVDASQPAAGRLLVANRDMRDQRFARSVVLLVAHGAQGSLGVVVNRPLKVHLASAFPQLGLTDDPRQVLWHGGPVRDRQASVLVATDSPPVPSSPVLEGLHFSTRFEHLRDLLHSPGAARIRVYAGHAGWAPRQLEAELARGDWAVHPGSVAAVFTDDATTLWQRLDGGAGTWVRRGAPGVCTPITRPVRYRDLDSVPNLATVTTAFVSSLPAPPPAPPPRHEGAGESG